ncbi:CPBP family intramembrane glutamic endopeptidase [Nocardia carnea]|uniref:CPBP family intramembrane glutamic endopeptidase n=1 Tax=Nocardia carnea TaxID=37328 RepID=A0ABW7TQ84_9NOCA|nr:CPBP family intramembrane glutamic endopeptidase [Nocardia carnea]
MSNRDVRPGLVRGPQSSATAQVWPALGTYVAGTLAASVALLVVQPHSGVAPAALSLVQFAPALGALATWLIFRRTVARQSPAPVSARRTGMNIVAVVGTSVVFGLLVAGAVLASGAALAGPAAAGTVPFTVFLLLQLLGATGEEVGWRGLMQPMLESRMTRFAAISVTGATWALWHVQAFAAGPVTAVCFVVSTMAFAVVLGYLSEGSYVQRVLVASVGHWLINIAVYLPVGDDTLGRPQVVFIAVAAVIAAAGVGTARALRRGDRSPLS